MTNDMTVIVLLHGLGVDWWSMKPLEVYLRYIERVSTRIVLPSLDYSALPSVDACADVVEAALDDGDDDLIIVGQSMGGIVGKRIAERKKKRVALLLTIASPHHGATLVRSLRRSALRTFYEWAWSSSAQHHAELERRLATVQRPPPCAYHTYSTEWFVGTGFDGCVYVPETRFDERTHTHFVCGDHRFIVADVRLMRHVAATIRRESNED